MIWSGASTASILLSVLVPTDGRFRALHVLLVFLATSGLLCAVTTGFQQGTGQRWQRLVGLVVIAIIALWWGFRFSVGIALINAVAIDEIENNLFFRTALSVSEHRVFESEREETTEKSEGFHYPTLGRIRHGRSVILDERGEKTQQREYKWGRRDGKFEVWFANGQRFVLGRYKMGEKDGQWKVWYPSGNVRAEGSFENGKPVDPWRYCPDTPGSGGTEGPYAAEKAFSPPS